MKLLTIIATSAALMCSLPVFSAAAPTIPSNFGESLREYEAIITAQDILKTAISEAEAIVEIDRITKSFKKEFIKYRIGTVVPGVKNSQNNYEVTLKLVQNPKLGPPLIQVIAIRKLEVGAC